MSHRYALLLSSLPPIDSLFGSRRLPISRVLLEKRLEWLDPEDWSVLERIESVVRWDQLASSLEDSGFVERARELLEALPAGTIRDLVKHRLELRTVVAALRRRLRGASEPPSGDWGLGSIRVLIERRWAEPDFGLAHRYLWLPAVREGLAAGEPLEVERLILSAVWRDLGRVSPLHQFDFEAVVVYVLRWGLVDRWMSHDAARAGALFNTALDELVAPWEGDIS